MNRGGQNTCRSERCTGGRGERFRGDFLISGEKKMEIIKKGRSYSEMQYFRIIHYAEIQYLQIIRNSEIQYLNFYNFKQMVNNVEMDTKNALHTLVEEGSPYPDLPRALWMACELL